jgi:hypothetical protein
VTGGPITTSGTLYFGLENTSVTAGSYGTSSSVGSFTVDAKGRLTAASNTAISITTGQVSDGVVKSVFGEQGVVTSIDYAQFDTAVSLTLGTGKLTWDSTNGTLDLGLAGGTVNSLLGVDLNLLVYNQTASAFTRGQVVIADGSSGTRLAVDLALGDSDANTAETFGVVNEPISKNQSGFVMTKGLLRGINTNSFNEGDVLWVSSVTPGAITNVRPDAPNHAVRVGYCIKKAGIADGIIYVDPLNGFELGELHDVSITGVANNNFLVYDGGDKRWENYTAANARTALGLGTAALQSTTYFAPATTGTAILAGNGSGGFSAVTVGTGLTYTGGTLSSLDVGGTVTSVALTAGTGISISGGPITSSGSIQVTNTAPDQTVVLTQGGTTTITGTYPNFTISSADQYVGTVTSVSLTAGTGISISGGPITSSGAIEVINTAPDQTVVLTGTGTTSVTGTYPNFTINSADQYTGTVTSVTAQGSADISVTGGPITTSGTLYFSLSDTSVTAGNYGTAGSVPSFTVDAKGRLTAAANVPIAITAGQVSGLPSGGTQYVYKTANYTTQDGEGVLADTSGGAFTVTLPATPTVGDTVVVADAGAAFGTNNLTIGRNGSTINGTAENLICDITGVSVTLVYDGTTWEVYAQVGGNGGNAVTLNGIQTLTNKTISGASNTITNISLTASVTGTLPVANGGTGSASGDLSNCTADGTNAVGFKTIPQNSQSAAYTAVLADSGKHILHPSADTTARTFTIPANGTVAYPIGTALTFINQNGAGTVTIAITSDTMRLAGAGTTGSRTLAANGVATAIKITSTEWIISGTGLT